MPVVHLDLETNAQHYYISGWNSFRWLIKQISEVLSINKRLLTKAIVLTSRALSHPTTGQFPEYKDTLQRFSPVWDLENSLQLFQSLNNKDLLGTD